MLAADLGKISDGSRRMFFILDDWMRDELTPTQAQDILEGMDDRYGYASTIVASQKPVSDWFMQIANPTFGDAILDCLVHTIPIGFNF